MLNTNFTHNFQEPMCVDVRMFQHEYPLLLRLRCTGPLSLLQDGRQSNMGLLCNNTSLGDDWLNSLYSWTHQSFVSCQLVDVPKLPTKSSLTLLPPIWTNHTSVGSGRAEPIDGQIFRQRTSHQPIGRRSSWSSSTRRTPAWKNPSRPLHPIHAIDLCINN